MWDLVLDELMISVPHFDIDATMLEEQEDQDDAKAGKMLGNYHFHSRLSKRSQALCLEWR